MKDPNGYLFDFATGAMAVVLALSFEKLAQGIGSVSSTECNLLRLSVGVATNFAILLVLVSVLATLSFAHREMSVAYRRSYFMLDLLTGALLLCIAVECASNATFSPTSGSTSMIVSLLTLAVTFSFLLVRALLLWGNLSTTERRLASPAIFQVMGFHGLGILLSLTAVMLLRAGHDVASGPVLVCSLAAVAGATVYLSFFWVFRLRVRLESREPHSGSGPPR